MLHCDLPEAYETSEFDAEGAAPLPVGRAEREIDWGERSDSSTRSSRAKGEGATVTERAIAIVEARMGSTRLPGKSMRSLLGKPLVEHVLARIKRATRVNAVVLATSDSPKDDVLASHVAALGIPVHRGDEHDVLDRILGAARRYGATIHVQCWGDCPFVDADQIDAVVSKLHAEPLDVVTNFLGTRSVPHGLETLAMRVAALEEADRQTQGHPYHREHGTTYLYETRGAFRVGRVDDRSEIAYPKLDLTINTEQDFLFVEALYEAIGSTASVAAVIDLLRRRPQLLPPTLGLARIDEAR